MQYKEIRSLEREERHARIIAEKENIKKLRFSHAISPLENPMRIRYSRRLIAKLKTAENALKSKNKNSDAEKS